MSQNSNLLFAQAALLNPNQCDSQGVKYDLNLSTQTATVAAYQQVPSGTTKWNVVIPDKVNYNGAYYTVTSLAKNAFDEDYCLDLAEKLKSVDLSGCKSLTSIGASAFYDCSGLTSVTFPESLTSIGRGAFYGCSRLTSVKIGGKLESFSKIVFGGCTSLSKIEITGSEKYFTVDNVVYEITDATKKKARLILFPIGHKTGASTTTSFAVLETVQDSNGNDYTVTEIGDNAFYYCSGLTSVTFPENLTSIGGSAFKNCSELKSVDLSECESLTIIGASAFYGCSGLESVDLSGCTSLGSIGESAFKNCSELKSVDLSQCTKLTSIGESAFEDCSKLTSVDLSGCTSLGSIGESAFEGCSKLTSVDLSECESLTSIGASAFYGCIGLTSVTFPASLTSMGASAFSGCSGLKSVDLSGCKSLTSIGNYAFKACSKLTSVTFPASLTSIGNGAFWGCSGLELVVVPGGDVELGSYVFYNCGSYKTVVFQDSADNTLQTQFVFTGKKSDGTTDKSAKAKNPDEYGIMATWYTDEETNVFNFSTIFTGRGEIVLKTKNSIFDVVFKSGEEVLLTQKVESGLTATKPDTDPTREGYTFMGWYLGEEKFDFDTPITEDTKLTAKWGHVVTFDLNGGTLSGSTASQKVTVESNTKLTGDEYTPTREGYTFMGWFDGETEFDFTKTPITKDTKLTAKWNKVVILVKSFEDAYGKMIFKRIFRTGEESGWGRIIESFFNPEAASEMEFKIFHDSTEYAYKDIYFECFYADPDKGVLKVRMQVPAQDSGGNEYKSYKIIQTKSPANTLLVLP